MTRKSTQLPQLCALAVGSADERARFRTEAQAAPRVQHPNVVQVFEVGERARRPYFSMEFCPGGSLEQKLGAAVPTPRAAARLVEQIAHGVQAVHDAGVIHRDLKPANVLFTGNDVPKVADFGLARLTDAATAHTATGAVLGTPAYMAPEQASGRAKDATAATDVYALGAILYECLTGRPPFAGANLVEILDRVRTQEPVPPRRINPALSRDLEAVCLKCLEKDPARRYATAQELADDLRNYLEGRPTVARPLTWAGRAYRFARRHPGVTWRLALAAVALAAGSLALAVWPRDDSLAQVQQAGKLRVAMDTNYPPMESWRDGQLVGFDIDLMREVAERLGVEVEFVSVEWDWAALAARLRAGEFDAIVSAVTASDERARDADFVVYLQLPMLFLGREEAAIGRPAQLAGKVVAVQRGTVAQQQLERLRDSGVALEVLSFTDINVPVKAVQKGTADLFLAEEPVIRHLARTNPGLTVAGTFGHRFEPEPIGIAFRPGSKALQNAIAGALKDMRRDEKQWDARRDRWLER